MKVSKLFLAFVFATASTAAFAAGWPADDPSGTTSAAAQADTPRTGRDIALQNEAQKRRLEAQGFPQYDD